MRVTIQHLKRMKRRGEKIAMLTAYDHPSAKIVEAAGIPIILVGDSLGNVILGYDSTLPVTMEDMLHHVKAVVRGTQKAHVVADMPFMSYQVDEVDALRNAGRLLQEGGAQSVKLEGGRTIAGTVRRIVDVGIPVMGHLGLTPQSVNQLGGYRVQGKSAKSAQRLVEDALALEEAGAYALVLELVPASLAENITDQLSIPTIGIGSGVHCDGQVQVFHDMMGLIPNFVPKHTRRYANLADITKKAVEGYIKDTQSQNFPSDEESFILDLPVADRHAADAAN